MQLVNLAPFCEFFSQGHSTSFGKLAPLCIFAAFHSGPIGKFADIAPVHGSTQIGRIDCPHSALLFYFRQQLSALNFAFSSQLALAPDAVLAFSEKTGPTISAVSEHGDRD